MPSLLPLRSGELPLFIKPKSTESFSFSRTWRSLHRKQRSIIIFLCAFVLFGFAYTQLYSFSNVIQSAENREAAEIAARNDKNHGKKIPNSDDKAENVEQVEIPPEVPKENVEALNDKDDSKAVGQNPQVVQPEYPKFKGPQNDRQKAVVGAMKHAWNGYKKYAWGKDQLMPISGGTQEWMGCGLTILDSLDSLLIMGMDNEFSEARQWVSESLDFEKDRFVSLFETTIRVLGGLLSTYHLSGDKLFLTKAEDIGSRLIGALNAPSPIPFSDVNLQTRKGKQPSWGGESSLSEVSSIQLEFRDLSRALGNDTYEKAAFKISEHIHSLGCKDHQGLCGMFLSPLDGKFRTGTTITLGARADSYYEYLLKQWLQTGKTITWLHDDYKEAMTGVQNLLWHYSEPNKLGFPGELLGGKTFSPKMDHLVCFLAGTLALGTQNAFEEIHLDMAKNLSKSCREMYSTLTGLAPEIVYFNEIPGKKEDISIKPLDAHCLLRPEAFEAWFYLYRVTGDKQYQEWGWEAFQAIEQFAKVKNGYSSVNSVKKIPVTYRDLMESFFLAETLKYLYLLFADDQNEIPLDKYVFNTEGHPLPIYSN
uniref:Alpha-1,2-Mannosidase n=1 Tax=Panagrolaimus sp. PS1159 TaxID=55785 RepID=A0AC35GN67_9BILA